jgi:hypothetical protein
MATSGAIRADDGSRFRTGLPVPRASDPSDEEFPPLRTPPRILPVSDEPRSMHVIVLRLVLAAASGFGLAALIGLAV